MLLCLFYFMFYIIIYLINLWLILSINKNTEVFMMEEQAKLIVLEKFCYCRVLLIYLQVIIVLLRNTQISIKILIFACFLF